jgi:hypothetical protein
MCSATRRHAAREWLRQHLGIQEQERAQGLILRRRGNLLLNGESGEESLDFGQAHFVWMALLMEQHESFDPADVGFLSTQRIMFAAQHGAHLVEQSRGVDIHRE